MAEAIEVVKSEQQVVGSSHLNMQDAILQGHPRYAREHLTMEFDAYQVHQKVQIEKETLRFFEKMPEMQAAAPVSFIVN